LDPATLHGERPDRQGAYRHCSRRARAYRQSAEARPPGGHFQGVKAQLMLKPKGGTAGKPTTGAHAQGEISMDSAATLWVCTVAGTPGTWRKVTTTAT